MITTLIATAALLQVTPTPVYTQSSTTPEGLLQLRTAAHRLTSPGKPDIWLVGAIHIGNKDYYSSLQTLLDSTGLVLFEGVKPSAKQLKEAAEKPATAQTETKHIYKVLSDALGVEFQSTQINTKKPNWRNCDLSWDDMEKLHAADGGSSSYNTVKQLFDPNSPNTKMLTTLLETATPGLKEGIKVMLVKGAGGSTQATGLGEKADKIILDARNDHVLKTIDEEIASGKAPKSISVFYGAAHLSKIEQALGTKHGYKFAEEKWFTAMEADPKKVDAMGKMIVDGFEKQQQQKNTTGTKSGGGKQTLNINLPLAA